MMFGPIRESTDRAARTRAALPNGRLFSMLPLDRQIAESIDGVARALAEWSVGALYERNADFTERYGALGRALWKGEMVNRLQYLSEGIAADRSALFVQSVEWARAAFVARNMDPRDLAESLLVLDETIRAELPAQVASRASRFIQEGIAAARRVPRGDGGPADSLLDSDEVDGNRARLYLLHLLERKQSKAVDVLLDGVRSGLSVADVYEKVISPALVEVGRMWHLREATVADEHYVTAATQSAMSVLRGKLPQATPNGKRILAASVGGDLHDVGIRMVADLLESEGFQVECMGANMPVEDIIEHAIDELGRPQFDLIALSASTGLAIRSIASAIAAIRNATPDHHQLVMVGGGPFVSIPDLWKVVDADGSASTASDAVRVASRLCE